MKNSVAWLFYLAVLASAQAAEPLHRIVPRTPEALRQVFAHGESPLPFLSAHRGGPDIGYPENCIETFEHTLQRTWSALEIDPRRTKDGVIVLHHDVTLDRTTTGKGKLSDHTLAELKQLRLKDVKGEVTSFRMPTLDEAIDWARGKTVLVIDQKDMSAEERARFITEKKAESFVMMIVSSFKDVQKVHAINPEIKMEVMIPNRKKVEEFDELGVPWVNVVAFVGHKPSEDPELCRMIHARGASCMIGTSRHLDRKVLNGEVDDIQSLAKDYRAFIKRGADVIETDIPVELGKLVPDWSKVPEDRQTYFQVR